MKQIKYFLSILLYSICAFPMNAQVEGEYQLTISFGRMRNSGNPMNSTEYSISSVSNVGTKFLRYWKTGSLDKGEYFNAPSPIISRFTKKERPYKLLFWGKRTWGWVIHHSSKGDNELLIDSNTPYLHRVASHGDNGGDFFPAIQTTLTIEVLPVFIHLHYYTDKGQGTASSLNLLPDNDVITLKATKGFVESTYKWQYQTIGESIWHDMPNTVSYSEGKSVVTFKGTDLYARSAFNELVRQGKNILFRINAITDETRNEADYKKIILTPTYSAPHILSHDITLEQCHQSGDASLRVFLDRPLWPGEALAVFKTGGTGSNIDALDAENSFRINDLAAGAYTFQLRGTHSNGQNTYRETSKHILNVTINERPAITHSFIQKNISCFSGHDGEIMLTASGTLAASGGTGNFTATLTDAGGSVVQTQTFNTGNVSFKRLSAGNYTLRVQDSNGCVAKTSSGEELIHQVILTEPSEAVSITEKSKTSPLAYQSSDGAIQIAVSGGTPSASGYTVRFVRKSDGQVFAPTDSHSDGNQYIYTLRNIPRGEYTAIAEDMRFALLGNEDKQDPCGCHAQLAMTLSAPPLLTVDVEETHFVSCHGDSDGELTAHGKGGKPIISAQLPYTYAWYKISGSTKEQLPLQIDSVAHNLSTGQYQVKITDSNGISVESAVFELKQPDLLSLSFTTRPPSCSGGAGLISTTVTGGTAPET